eukprot:1326830-Rhodomonas_salina.2
MLLPALDRDVPGSFPIPCCSYAPIHGTDIAYAAQVLLDALQRHSASGTNSELWYQEFPPGEPKRLLPYLSFIAYVPVTG